MGLFFRNDLNSVHVSEHLNTTLVNITLPLFVLVVILPPVAELVKWTNFSSLGMYEGGEG